MRREETRRDVWATRGFGPGVVLGELAQGWLACTKELLGLVWGADAAIGPVEQS